MSGQEPAPAEDVVERVARAILPWVSNDAFRNRPRTYEEIPSEELDDIRDCARAVLAAMPQEALAENGLSAAELDRQLKAVLQAVLHRCGPTATGEILECAGVAMPAPQAEEGDCYDRMGAELEAWMRGPGFTPNAPLPPAQAEQGYTPEVMAWAEAVFDKEEAIRVLEPIEKCLPMRSKHFEGSEDIEITDGLTVGNLKAICGLLARLKERT